MAKAWLIPIEYPILSKQPVIQLRSSSEASPEFAAMRSGQTNVRPPAPLILKRSGDKPPIELTVEEFEIFENGESLPGDEFQLVEGCSRPGEYCFDAAEVASGTWLQSEQFNGLVDPERGATLSSILSSDPAPRWKGALAQISSIS
jgi:hypothetical protein